MKGGDVSLDGVNRPARDVALQATDDAAEALDGVGFVTVFAGGPIANTDQAPYKRRAWYSSKVQQPATTSRSQWDAIPQLTAHETLVS